MALVSSGLVLLLIHLKKRCHVRSLYSLLRNFELLFLKPHLGGRGKDADATKKFTFISSKGVLSLIFVPLSKKVNRVSRSFITTLYKVLKEHSTRVWRIRVGALLMEWNVAGKYKACFALIMIDVITLCSVIQC